MQELDGCLQTPNSVNQENTYVGRVASLVHVGRKTRRREGGSTYELVVRGRGEGEDRGGYRDSIILDARERDNKDTGERNKHKRGLAHRAGRETETEGESRRGGELKICASKATY